MTDLMAESSSSSTDATIALLAPLHMELGPLAGLLRLGRRGRLYRGQLGSNSIVACVGGVGAERVTACFEKLMREHRPAWVIHLGFAGGLDPQFDAAQVLTAGRVLNESGRSVQLGNGAGESGCTLLSVDRLANSVELKRKLFERHHAAAVDMESFAVAEAASHASVELSILRAISDPADLAVPPQVFRMITAEGKVDVGAAARTLLRHPDQLPVMWKLGRTSRQAGRNLANAVRNLLLERA